LRATFGDVIDFDYAIDQYWTLVDPSTPTTLPTPTVPPTPFQEVPDGAVLVYDAARNIFVPSTSPFSALNPPAGKSAYQSAVDNGFVGTEAEWVDSLHGAAAFYTGAEAPTDPSVNVWLDTSSSFGPNLLVGDESSFDTTLPSIWSTANCTAVWNGTYGDPAPGSIAYTRGANTSSMDVHSGSSTGGLPCVAGDTFDVFGRIRPDDAAPLCLVRWFARFYDSTNTNILTTPFGDSITEVAGEFTPFTFTTTAPANATHFVVVAQVIANGVQGDTHYLDDVWVRKVL
jgi:hypothetical protein